MLILKWLFVMMICVTVLSMVNTFFFFKSSDKSANTPFECGMDQIQKARNPIYMHFIFITLVFLIFDIELVITIPVILSLLSESVWNSFWVLFFFIMSVGLLLEIVLGTIDWKN